ncbi:hypothetical protein P691DRAFT_804422 [Macrolepiota fuliginosa MF-IS2]|uniref:Uncharacterized protein n=1 Tax=Macrolepiota fuliginosa MF-IS2 TaxID=1400762 RepID=A0A9P6C277_9AGAR|nr:hypothetical protein P691DRAFT_804422 [Macrolepiota fuliginosa MF-IS2]
MRPYYHESPIFISVLSLPFFLLISANLIPSISQLNTTIEGADSSIIYWPSASWASITTDDETQLLYPHCILTQGTKYHIARPRSEEEQTIATRTTQAQHSNTDDESDDWWIPVSSHAPQQIGNANSDPDAVAKDPPDNAYLPTTVRFTFIGSAVYLFGTAIHPSAIDVTSTLGVAFAIDGELLQSLTAAGEDSHRSWSCSTNEPIFSHGGLSDDRHELVVTIPPSITFLLDYIIYTRPTHDDFASAHKLLPTPTLSPPGSGSQVTLKPRAEDASSTATPPKKKHSIATFAAAVGTVVGILAIISFAVAFSIIRRRRLAKLRDLAESSSTDANGNTRPHIRARRISSSSSSSSSSSNSSSSSSALHTDASEDTPNPNLNVIVDPVTGISTGGVIQMEGPAPFVPRFFPGTTVLQSQQQQSQQRGGQNRNRDASIPTLLPPPPPPPLPLLFESARSSIEQDPPPYESSITSSPISHATATTTTNIGSSPLISPRPLGISHLDVIPGDGRNSGNEDSDLSYADVPPPTPPPPPMISRPPSPSSVPIPLRVSAPSSVVRSRSPSPPRSVTLTPGRTSSPTSLVTAPVAVPVGGGVHLERDVDLRSPPGLT